MAAATPFIQNLPTEVQAPLVLPDFSQIQNIAQRANSIFEQGIGQIKNDYSAVLNSPVSSLENISKKQEYVNNFRSGLKNFVRSSDLTMPQNVLQAENLLQPFWSDEELLQDMSKTKQYSSNQQMIDGWKNSTDEKIRTMYSPYQEQYNSGNLQELREAKRGDGSIARVNMSKPIPFGDPVKELNAQAKEQNYEIDWVTGTDGPILYEHKNGKRFERNFALFAKNVLGDRWNEQFRIMGEVEKRRVVGQYRQLGYEKDIAEQKVGSDLYNTAVGNLMKQQQYTQTNMQGNDVKIQSYKNKAASHGGLTPDEEEDYLQLLDTQSAYKRNLSDMEDNLRSYAEPDFKSNYIRNPGNYMAQNIKNDLINTWAGVRASFESVKAVANQGWANYQTAQHNRADEAIRWHHEHEDERTHRANENLRGIEAGISAVSNGYILGPGGQLFPLSGQGTNDNILKPENKIGYASDELNKVKASDVAIAAVNKTKSDLANTLWSGVIDPRVGHASGLSFVLNQFGGMSTDEVSTLNTYMSNLTNDNTTKPDRNTKVVLDKYFDILKSHNIRIDDDDKYTNIDKLSGGLKAYAGKISNDPSYAKDPSVPQSINTLLMNANILERVNSMNMKNTASNVNAIVSRHPENYQGTVVNKGGQYDMVHPDNISGTLQSAGVDKIRVIGPNGSEQYISTSDIAKAFYQKGYDEKSGSVNLNGKVYKIADDSYRLINGRMVKESADDGQWHSPSPMQGGSEVRVPVRDYINNILSRNFGTSEQFSDKLGKLVTEAVPGIKEKTGVMGKVYAIPYTTIVTRKGKKEEEINPSATRTIEQIVTPDNHTRIYNEKGEEVKDKTITKGIISDLTQLSKQPENVIQRLIGKPEVHLSGFSGTPVVKLSINKTPTQSSEENSPSADLARNSRGHSFYLEINPLTDAPELRKILSEAPTGVSLFPELEKGETYTSPVVGGTYFQVIPDRKDEHFNEYTVEIHSTTTDPKTGEVHEAPVKRMSLPKSEVSADRAVSTGVVGTGAIHTENAAKSDAYNKSQYKKSINQIEQEYKATHK